MRHWKGLFYALGGVGALALTLFVGWWQVDGPGAPAQPSRLPSSLTAMDLALTDHEGAPVGPETLIGRPSMVFFGFTYCPDVCPTTLSDITDWLDELGPETDRLNAVFITIDPERDTQEALADYVSAFHPAIRGWTGPEEEIARAVEGFRAVYERVPAEEGGYTMNHTASVFLFRRRRAVRLDDRLSRAKGSGCAQDPARHGGGQAVLTAGRMALRQAA
jgi:protein SCO1/2